MPFGSRSRKRFEPGEPVRADDINRISEEASFKTRPSDSFALREMPDGLILDLIGIQGFQALQPTVRMVAMNDTGADLDAYEVAAISGQPNDDYLEERSIELSLEDFDADNLELLAIAMEPIADGEAGSVAVMGVWWAKCSGTLDTYATPVSGGQAMIMATSGPAQVLFYDATNTMALVRFGGGTASSGGGTVNWQFVWNEGA